MNDLLTVFDITDPDERRGPTSTEVHYLNMIFMVRARHREEGYVAAEDIDAKIGELFGEDSTSIALVQMMLAKLKWCDPTVGFSPYVVLAAALFADRPGQAVLWAYSIYRKAREGDYTLADFMAYIGQHGVPSEDAYAKLWEAQKDRGSPLGNRLDNREVWSAALPAT